MGEPKDGPPWPLGFGTCDDVEPALPRRINPPLLDCPDDLIVAYLGVKPEADRQKAYPAHLAADLYAINALVTQAEQKTTTPPRKPPSPGRRGGTTLAAQ